MKQLSKEQAAYIAGFLDADGSLIAQFKKNKTFKLSFQFQLTIQFTQDNRNVHILELFKKQTGLGPAKLRKRDKVSDFIITSVEQIKVLLIALKPYIQVKKGQVNHMLRIIELIPNMRSSLKFFKEVCELADKISAANYNKKTRKNTGSLVLNHVINNKFFDNLDPVETSANILDFKINEDFIDDLDDFDIEQ